VQDEQLELIAELVREQSGEGQCRIPTRHAADILDHFGTQEVWLKIMYRAHHEESLLCRGVVKVETKSK
jgi:uncharacterized protein